MCMFTVTRVFIAGCTRIASNITNYSARVPAARGGFAFHETHHHR